MRAKLEDWVENGKAPDEISCRWAAKKTTIPVAAYPGLSVLNGDRWTTVTLKRGASARLGDKVVETAISPAQ